MMYGGGDDDEGPRLKERIADACCKGVDLFCVWADALGTSAGADLVNLEHENSQHCQTTSFAA